MRTFNFIGDTTYTTREGISYRIDNKEHNIQRVGKSWVVDGKASSLEEMVKMGIVKKNIARVYNNTAIDKVAREVVKYFDYLSILLIHWISQTVISNV